MPTSKPTTRATSISTPLPAAGESITHSGPILRAYGELEPRLHESVWIAPGAVVVGDVEIGADSSVFYGSVLRGDVERIRIGERTNIQDQATIHVSQGIHPALLGDEITVGHRAVVHGCRVGHGALIGIGAIVLDGAEIGEEALVAAGAVVTPGTRIEPRTLAVGMPARPVRVLTPEELASQRARALQYVETARAHAASFCCGRDRSKT
jgi:carbonic anhydrase/acetyltransferase-like protein (isoleucine patch superfamily)